MMTRASSGRPPIKEATYPSAGGRCCKPVTAVDDLGKVAAPLAPLVMTVLCGPFGSPAAPVPSNRGTAPPFGPPAASGPGWAGTSRSSLDWEHRLARALQSDAGAARVPHARQCKREGAQQRSPRFSIEGAPFGSAVCGGTAGGPGCAQAELVSARLNRDGRLATLGGDAALLLAGRNSQGIGSQTG